MITTAWLAHWLPIGLVGDHLFESTLCAAAAAVLAWLLRRQNAEVRHWIWLAASLKFLIPFALLVALGSQFSWRVPERIVGLRVAGIVQAPSQPLPVHGLVAGPQATRIADAFARRFPVLPILLLIVWAAGSAALLAYEFVCWRRLSTAIRQGSPILHGQLLDTVRRLERCAGITRRITVLSLDSFVPPGVFGIVHPVLLWPRPIVDCLSHEQIEAILTHEICHVRRHDNLAAALHRVVQAVFWFHPLVWWLGTRLIEERERACDEEVIRSGREPQVYAESIIRTCQLAVAPALAAMGVTGAKLSARIERILRPDAAVALDRWRALLVTAVGIGAIGIPLVIGVLDAPPLQAHARTAWRVTGRSFGPPEMNRWVGFELLPGPAQYATNDPHHAAAWDVTIAHPAGRTTPRGFTGRSVIRYAYDLQESTSPARLLAQSPDGHAKPAAFEVASVKPNKSGENRIGMFMQPGGRFTATNATLAMLLSQAYRLQGGGRGGSNAQLVGAPSWVASDHFDIVAKADPAATPDQVAEMIKALLAERFKLAAHTESRELPVYALVLARSDGKLGQGLRPVSADCAATMASRGRGGPAPGGPGGAGRGPGVPPAPPQPGDPQPCGSMRIGPGMISGGGTPLSQLANSLSVWVNRIVVDRTGLTGSYEVELRWTPEQLAQGGPGPGGPPPPPGAPASGIDAGGPSIFTAVQEQLGLKLDATKGPVDVLVIEHVEQPTED